MKAHRKTETLAMVAAVLAIAALLAVGVFAQGMPFRFFGPLSRIITPNGDASKPNGTAVFCVDNPAQSDVSGKIYTLLGSEVAPLSALAPNVLNSSCPAGVLPGSGEYLTWDGRSNGAVVHSGIYVYRVTAELKVYSGTLIVVR